MVGLFYSVGAEPSIPPALLLFRSSAIISGLLFLSQILDLKKLENFLETTYLLMMAFMAVQVFLRVEMFSVELDWMRDIARQFAIAL